MVKTNIVDKICKKVDFKIKAAKIVKPSSISSKKLFNEDKILVPDSNFVIREPGEAVTPDGS
jgi:hypothetical protein